MRRCLAIVILACAGCDGGEDPLLVVPDAAVDAAPDGDTTVYECNCNPVAQVGCDVDDQCTWISTDTTGYDACMPIGRIPVGGACTTTSTAFDDPHCTPSPTSRHDECAPGSLCVDGACARICDLTDPGRCSTCATVDGVFEYGGVYFGGVCR